MATNFPTSLDSFTNPTSSSTLDSPSHAAQHANINDAMEAVQDKLGVGNHTIGEWTNYTPTLTNWTVSAISAKYARINELIIVKISGTVSALTGTPIFTLPTTAAEVVDLEVGNAYLLDAGTNIYFARVLANNSTSAGVYPMRANTTYVEYGTMSASVPFTWAANDRINLQAIYEAA